jgi:cell wall-associated NlpC family hydrolase
MIARRRGGGGGVWLLGVAALLAASQLAPAEAPASPPAPGRRTGYAPAPARAVAARAVAYALAQRGKPYRWGADGPGAFDCSGLTMRAWQAAGVVLPRTAAAQYQTGRRVQRADLRPGDLVFYQSSGPSGWHVGLVVGRGRMVEAPGAGLRVRTAWIGRGGYRGAVRPSQGRRR